MKLSPRKREEVSSATITQTLLGMLGGFGVLALTASATDPSWWSSAGTGSQAAVLTPQVVTNDGVVTTNYVPNPNAVVVQGQVKQFTARAVDEMNAFLPGGAGTTLNGLVCGWAQDYATNAYGSTTNAYAPYKPGDFTAMNVGQLKYIGNQIWSQLVAAGYTNAVPAWLAQNSATDNRVAVLGQLKEVFNFDLSGPNETNTVTGLTAIVNGDGSVTLNWGFSASGGAVVIGGLDSSGTWDEIVALGSSDTSVTLTQDQIAGFGSLGVSNALLNALLSLQIGAIANPGYVAPRYAVIDLGTNCSPQKITDSGYVLSSTTTNNVQFGFPNITFAQVWSNGTNLTLQPATSSTPSWEPSDIAQDGTVVGIEWAPSPSSNLVAYTVPPAPLDGNLPNLAVWSAGSPTPTLTPPPIIQGTSGTSDAAYMDFGYQESSLGATSHNGNIGPSISTNSIWSTQVVGWNINPYSTIDGFQAVRSQGNGGVYGSQTELGHIVATSGTSPFGTSGQAGSYTGTATFPLAVNNSDQCLEEHDSGYTALFPTSPYPDWTPGTTTYTVGTTPVPSGLTPIASKGALSNTNAFGAYDVIGSNGQYVCWDGTHTIPLPPSSSANVSVSPVGVNAATTTITVPGTGTNPPTTQVVSATQVIGNYSVSNPNPPPAYLSTGYIWNMIPSTNAIPTFANPQKLDTLVPGYGTTNAAWSGIAASSINDSGAIVGTATYSGTNTAIPAGSHGVMLVPYDIDVDADNTTPVQDYPDPMKGDLGPAEKAAEYSSDTTNYPGVGVYENLFDAYNNGVVGYADGIDKFGNGRANACWAFTPMLIDCASLQAFPNAQFIVKYSASDPNQMTTDGSGDATQYILPDTGVLRIWKKDGIAEREPQTVDASGDFVQSNQAYTSQQLGWQTGDKTIRLYIEAVKFEQDQSFNVEVDFYPLGTSHPESMTPKTFRVCPRYVSFENPGSS